MITGQVGFRDHNPVIVDELDDAADRLHQTLHRQIVRQALEPESPNSGFDRRDDQLLQQ